MPLSDVVVTCLFLFLWLPGVAELCSFGSVGVGSFSGRAGEAWQFWWAWWWIR